VEKTGTDSISLDKRGLSLFFLALLFACASLARADEQRVLELDNGDRLGYALRVHPADAHLLDAGAEQGPSSALNTAKLVMRYLSEGRIEEASLLSNSPKARYARLRESFEGWKEGDFRRAYGRYFAPENRIVGEIAIDGHRLLMWHLKDTDHLAAFFLVEIEGRLLLDDVPNQTRANLRRVLEAYRNGKVNEK
jgi:hypothetical protein